MAYGVMALAGTMGRRWAIPLLEEVALGKFEGFNAVLRRAGMTPRILSRSLRELEGAGLISKHAVMVGGRSVTRYTLTEKGRDAHALIVEVKKWGIRWGAAPPGCLGSSCIECRKCL